MIEPWPVSLLFANCLLSLYHYLGKFFRPHTDKIFPYFSQRLGFDNLCKLSGDNQYKMFKASFLEKRKKYLTLFMLIKLKMARPCLIVSHSVGQLIWSYTVCKGRMYLGSARQGLRLSSAVTFTLYAKQ